MRRVTESFLIPAVMIAAATIGCGESGLLIPGLTPEAAHAAQGQYAILLCTLDSADHVERIQNYKAQTEKDTHWRDLFVFRKPDHSELYRGRYATQKQAARDLKKAKAYRTPLGVWAYAGAMVVPLPVTDIGPAEWNLRNARGAYTVVVAVFYDVPEARYFGRRNNAVEYCRQLRSRGIEAYYNHGSVRSTVSIGAFPESAVEVVNEVGRGEHTLIRDPGILAVQRQFPYLAVNGRQELYWGVNRLTKKAQKVPVVSYPARVPVREAGSRTDAFDSFGNTQSR